MLTFINSRRPRLRWVGLLVVALTIAGCEQNNLTEAGSAPLDELPYKRGDCRSRWCRSLGTLVVSPEATALAPRQAIAFAAKLVRGEDTTTATGVEWSATGGTIDEAGNYTAGMTAGTYRVVARSSSGSPDTSQVVISSQAPTVTAVVLTPSSVSLTTGEKKQLSVSARMSDGSATSVPVTWTATGGTVDTAKVYTAGTQAGTFRIIAKQLNGTLADTSAVTIAEPEVPQPEPPPSDGGGATGDYYVATTGSDNNPGTSAAPFRTIQKAAGVAGPGDVVIVRDGIYTSSSSNAVVSVGRSGTATAATSPLGRNISGAPSSTDGTMPPSGASRSTPV